MRSPLLVLVPLLLTGATGCGPATPTARPTSTATAASPSPSPAACPTDAEVLAAARGVNGGLPADAAVRPGSLVCEAGWAAGALTSEVGGVAILLHQVSGTSTGVVLGSSELCDVPEMPQAPAAVRTALHCG
ncbi:hypothetical protein Lfu02_09930 [Longispora fulva]|uniref:Lipoprotein n=1 Tax=Longispora fulva TaxID=619741 RepID=A0A8J7GB37_9ACTN|nr:hypothetical protein [Longispora fulva]MBG6135144.1 hypothetical protein [Longispora fulva]GIG56621.1 hypothetical protein Lfu02_09930 [Longispora fulva]